MTLPARPAAGGALDDQRVYIPLENEQVIALDRETGETRWTSEIESVWPAVAGSGIVVIAASDEIHALDPATGDRKWRVPIQRAVMAPMVMAGGLVLVPMAPDGLLAFRTDSGELAWAQSFGGSAGPAALTATDDSVYLSLAGARIIRISVRDGRMMWEQTLSGRLSQAAVARDRVFVGSTDNVLYALDDDKGRVVWRQAVGGDVVGAIADGDRIYFASLDNILRAVNRGNGNQRWKRILTTRAAAPPRSFGGIVVVSGVSPALATFNAKTGDPIAVYDAPLSRELKGAALIDPLLKPFRVAIVAIVGDGQAIGLRPVQMMFREPAPVPMLGLPGRTLPRETLPVP